MLMLWVATNGLLPGQCMQSLPGPSALESGSICNSSSADRLSRRGDGLPARRLLQALDLAGALRISGHAGAEVVVDGLGVTNAGWDWAPLQDSDKVCVPFGFPRSPCHKQRF